MPILVLISQFGIPVTQEWCKFQIHTCLCQLKFLIPCRYLYPILPRAAPKDRDSIVPFHPRGSPSRLPLMKGTFPVSVSHKSGTSFPISKLDSSSNSRSDWETSESPHGFTFSLQICLYSPSSFLVPGIFTFFLPSFVIYFF